MIPGESCLLRIYVNGTDAATASSSTSKSCRRQESWTLPGPAVFLSR